MGWEKYSSDLKIALMTNSFGDKLSRDHKNIHAKNCTSKCSSFWPTVKRMPEKKTSIILTTTVFLLLNIVTKSPIPGNSLG